MCLTLVCIIVAVIWMKALINHHTNLTTFVSNWYNPNCKTTMICSIICMFGVMCNVLTLSGVDRGIEPVGSSQNL
jgi:hypothetical protein